MFTEPEIRKIMTDDNARFKEVDERYRVSMDIFYRQWVRAMTLITRYQPLNCRILQSATNVSVLIGRGKLNCKEIKNLLTSL